jgi:hypothetical protein
MYNVGEMMENNTADGMQTVLQLLPFLKKNELLSVDSRPGNYLDAD